jgi:hypothetical protein
VGPRVVLDAVVKRKIPSPRWESNPRTPIVQPVAQRYTTELSRLIQEEYVHFVNTFFAILHPLVYLIFLYYSYKPIVKEP